MNTTALLIIAASTIAGLLIFTVARPRVSAPTVSLLTSVLLAETAIGLFLIHAPLIAAPYVCGWATHMVLAQPWRGER